MIYLIIIHSSKLNLISSINLLLEFTNFINYYHIYIYII